MELSFVGRGVDLPLAAPWGSQSLLLVPCLLRGLCSYDH